MRIRTSFYALLLGICSAGCAVNSTQRPSAQTPSPKTEPKEHAMFLPPVLADDWTKWIIGEWEGTGESDSGKGRGTAHFELGLSGQFLIMRSEAVLTEINPDYLKKNMGATDEELDRFKRSGYHSLELYTLDPASGEVIAYLFDNLRCIATGRGKREKFRETVDWHWHNGRKSTRVMERIDDDRMRVIERTPNPDGSVMEDRGEMRRIR